MSLEEKLLFVAAVSLRSEPSACPVWLDGDTVVYPETDQVTTDVSIFFAVDPAYQEAIELSFKRHFTAYVAARQGDRVYLYQVTKPSGRSKRDFIVCPNPYAKAVLSRHLHELGMEGRPFQPGALSRPSGLAEQPMA